MFQNLIQQSFIYVLDKEGLKLTTGKVVDVQKPFSQIGMSPLPGSTMKLTADVDGKSTEFNNIPCGSSMVTYGNTVVTDDKQVMLTEIENLHKSAKSIVDNIEYYKKASSSYESMMKELNPQFAKDKQYEEDLTNLKSEVSGMKDSMNDIKDMLSKVLNVNTQQV